MSNMGKKEIKKGLYLETIFISIALIAFSILFVRDNNKELKQTLLEYINSHNLNDNVQFLGIVNNPEDFLSMADILIMPSIYEGLPSSLIEAQISGINCIVSNNITKDAILTKNVIQLGIQEKDIDYWCNTILELSKKRYERKLVSNNNIVQIREAGYDIRYNAVELYEIYKNLLERLK